jgi:tetratricopeptide (TPR) repeat protein
VFRSVGDVLAPPRDIPQFSPDYYRPLTIATYLLDRAVGGGDAFPFHLSVVLAHTVASVLVYALALQLLAVGRSGRRTAAAPRADSSDAVARVGAVSAGALFALHPIHTESVAWAAGRSDVLATGFLLAVLVVTGQAQRTWVTSVLGAAFALAALGAKETAVAIYPLMFLRDVLVPPMPRPTRSDWLRGWVGPLLAGLVYVLLRRNALGEFVGSAPDALAAGQRSLGDLIGAVGMYLGRLVWPVPLNAYIDHIDTGTMTVGLALVFVAGFATAFWLWNRARVQGIEGSRVQASPGKRAPTTRGSSKQAPARNLESSNPRTLNVGILLFGLAWLGLTLAPSLAIVWKIPDAPIAERYLYLPSVGFCLLIGYAAARAWAAASTQSTRWAVAGAVALLLLASAIVTVRRNPVWHDDIALWEDTEQNSQVSGMAARSAGTAYQQAGRPADARAAFERALQRRNTQRGLQTIYNNLGTLAMFDRDYAAAQRYYEAAMAAIRLPTPCSTSVSQCCTPVGGRAKRRRRRCHTTSERRVSTRTTRTSRPRKPRPTTSSANAMRPCSTPGARSTSAPRARPPTACARCCSAEEDLHGFRRVRGRLRGWKSLGARAARPQLRVESMPCYVSASHCWANSE